MNRKALLIIIIFIIALFSGIYKLILSQNSSVSGLKVMATPVSSIYLNDKLYGKTPLEIQEKSGEYIMKLIPDDASYAASAWQGKVTLNPSVLTFVRKDLGTSELKTAGEILVLEKIPQSEADVGVSVLPEGATVLLDGQEKGASPLVVRDVIPGEHDVAVSSPGFIQRTVKIQATTGYKLNVNFQLALSENEEATQTAVLTPVPSLNPSEKKEPAKPYILIKETPTGFLRVRSGPNLSATETAQVKPGEKYSLVEEQEGWFKISIENGKEGWVSSRYCSKVE